MATRKRAAAGGTARWTIERGRTDDHIQRRSAGFGGFRLIFRWNATKESVNCVDFSLQRRHLGLREGQRQLRSSAFARSRGTAAFHGLGSGTNIDELGINSHGAR